MTWGNDCANLILQVLDELKEGARFDGEILKVSMKTLEVLSAIADMMEAERGGGDADE